MKGVNIVTDKKNGKEVIRFYLADLRKDFSNIIDILSILSLKGEKERKSISPKSTNKKVKKK